MPWRPQVALFVHDPTLLPVLIPLAPAATVLARFPDRLGEILQLHDIDQRIIERDTTVLTQHHLTSTSSRRIVGVMKELTHLASI